MKQEAIWTGKQKSLGFCQTDCAESMGDVVLCPIPEQVSPPLPKNGKAWEGDEAADGHPLAGTGGVGVELSGLQLLGNPRGSETLLTEAY